MKPILVYALIIHLFLGLSAIVALAAFSLTMAKRQLNLVHLKLYSLIGALTFIGSWIAGGYYYSTYYGKTVKSIILAGSYPWVHKVLMESKEHLFLFLPFLATTLFVTTLLGGKHLEENEKLKRGVIKLVTIIVGLGVAVTIFGLAISGAVTKR